MFPYFLTNRYHKKYMVVPLVPSKYYKKLQKFEKAMNAHPQKHFSMNFQ